MTRRDPYQGAYFTPSGGMVWHWRALWRRRYWSDFIDQIEADLQQWRPPYDALLLLGPSAGWCLPTSFLTRFKTIVALDLDPLAEKLFRFNHGKALAQSNTKLTFTLDNVFNVIDDDLKRFSDHAILFPNMLGQHIYHESDSDKARADVERVKDKLARHHWASIHDRLSGKIKSGVDLPAAFKTRDALPAKNLAERLNLSGEWVDHQTTDILPPGTERHLLGWRLLDDWMHIVEFGAVSPA